jgi:hypothetical protein
MYTPPDTQEIMSKYESTYSDVEERSLAGAFQHGLDAIKKELRSYNITGEKAAAYMIQYITTVTTNIATSAQQTALNLITSAYSLPKDLEYKNAQKELVEEQKTTVAEIREYDVKYREAQTSSLRESIMQNTLIKINSEANSMIGTLSANGVIAPHNLFVISMLAAEKALEALKTEEINGHDTKQLLITRNYNGFEVINEAGATRPALIREYRLPPNDRWSYELVLADGTRLTGTDVGGVKVYEELASRPLLPVYKCHKVSSSLFTDADMERIRRTY